MQIAMLPPPSSAAFSGWLREGGSALVYGWSGSGKSQLFVTPAVTQAVSRHVLLAGAHSEHRGIADARRGLGPMERWSWPEVDGVQANKDFARTRTEAALAAFAGSAPATVHIEDMGLDEGPLIAAVVLNILTARFNGAGFGLPLAVIVDGAEVFFNRGPETETRCATLCEAAGAARGAGISLGLTAQCGLDSEPPGWLAPSCLARFDALWRATPPGATSAPVA